MRHPTRRHTSAPAHRGANRAQRRRDVALATVVTGAMLVGLALTGGLGHAVAGVAGAARAVGKLAKSSGGTRTVVGSPAQFQYGVRICHRTGSARNPYVEIVISPSARPAHQRHGDIFPVPPEGCPQSAAAAVRGGSFRPPLQMRCRAGSRAGRVTTSVMVRRPVALRVSVSTRRGNVTILRGSRVGALVTRQATKTIVYRKSSAGRLQVRLRLPRTVPAPFFRIRIRAVDRFGTLGETTVRGIRCPRSAGARITGSRS